jgi:uncharacterized protein YbjT (DUF2867 family)
VILVTGAGGKTGRAVIQALAERGERVRAWVRRPQQLDGLPDTVTDAIAGDLTDPSLWRQACDGADALYFIAPNMHPDEPSLARLALDGAKAANVRRFVYHSVLHPQTRTMPHHWAKLQVEESLFASGLAFTILQPCAYMQNTLAYWDAITQAGEFTLPYPVTTAISVVDLADVAQVAAQVLTESGHAGAIYELAGPQALTQVEMAQILADVLNRPVRAREMPLAEWEAGVRGRLDAYAVDSLLAMFRYYARHGFTGNPNALGWLLGREPVTFHGWAAAQTGL